MDLVLLSCLGRARCAAAACLVLIVLVSAPVWAQDARTLAEQAEEQVRQGRYADALRLHDAALKLRESELGPDHPEVARALVNAAETQWRLGNYNAALALGQRSLAIREATLSPDHPDVADSLNTIARALHALAQYPAALPYYQRALAIREQALGPEHAETAAVLHNLGALYMARGQYDEARNHFERALAIRQKALGPTDQATATTMNNLGLLLYLQGQFAKAQEMHEAVLAMRERTLPPGHADIAQSLNNLAMTHWAQGRYPAAQQQYERTVRLLEAAAGPTHPDTATALNNLGSLYWAQGRFAEALRPMQRALEIREGSLGPEHEHTAQSLNNLGEIYRAQGQFSVALPLYERGLAINQKVLGPAHRSVGTTLNYVGQAYRAQGKYADAQQAFERALQVREKALGAEHADTASVLNNLAVLKGLQNLHDEALPFAQRALAIREKVLGPDHPDTAQSRHNLAWLLQRAGQPAAALPLYRTALASRESALGPDHPDVASTLAAIASLATQGDLVTHDEALALSRRSTSIWRRRAAEYGREATDRTAGSGRGELHTARDGLLTHVRLLARAPVSPQASAEAFEVAQLLRANSTGAAVAQMTARVALGDGELATQLRQRQDMVVRLRFLDGELLKALSRAGMARDPAAADRVRAEIRTTEAQLAALDARLLDATPAYRVLATNAVVPMAKAQALLRPGEALLSFLVQEQDTLLWVVRREQQQMVVLPIGRAELEQTVGTLRQGLDVTLARESSRPYPAELAHALYRKLLAPALPTLASTRRLLIVSDGPLQSLPLSVLLTAPAAQDAAPGQLAWLIRRYALSTLPSEASFVALRGVEGRLRAREPFVGFGDPAFQGHAGTAPAMTALYTTRGLGDATQLGQLPPLPDSAREITAMARLLRAGPDAVYLRDAATESRVKSLDLTRYKTLAFATHGFIAGELQGVVEPALALTPPAQPSELDDGLLTASEVARLRLNSDWVILSACSTAAPDGSLGAEGLSGLARAFIFAGSRSLLVSHWPVESRAASATTTGMLQELSRQPGLTRDEALRRAMLKLIASRNYSHPMFWAPFVYVGA